MNISDLLCDLYDIREMGKLCGFGKLPKDNEGTSFTIGGTHSLTLIVCAKSVLISPTSAKK